MTRLHYLPQLLEAKAARTSVCARPPSDFLRPVKRNRAFHTRAHAHMYVRLGSTHDERLANVHAESNDYDRWVIYELDSHESLNLYVCRPHSCDVVGDDAGEASTCLRLLLLDLAVKRGREAPAGTFLLWRVCKYTRIYVCTYVHASAFISVLLLLPPFCPRFETVRRLWRICARICSA